MSDIVIIKLTWTLLATIAAIGLLFVSHGFDSVNRFQSFLWRVNPANQYFMKKNGSLRKGAKILAWVSLIIITIVVWFVK